MTPLFTLQLGESLPSQGRDQSQYVSAAHSKGVPFTAARAAAAVVSVPTGGGAV